MPQFNDDIAQAVRDNTAFKRVLVTNEHSQIVLMSIDPGDQVGEEVHDVDQLLMFVEGTGTAVMNRERSQIGPQSLVAVPAGTRHNFINTGSTPLKLYTIFSPPEEAPGTVHETRSEALEAEASS